MIIFAARLQKPFRFSWLIETIQLDKELLYFFHVNDFNMLDSYFYPTENKAKYCW